LGSIPKSSMFLFRTISRRWLYTARRTPASRNGNSHLPNYVNVLHFSLLATWQSHSSRITTSNKLPGSPAPLYHGASWSTKQVGMIQQQRPGGTRRRLLPVASPHRRHGRSGLAARFRRALDDLAQVVALVGQVAFGDGLVRTLGIGWRPQRKCRARRRAGRRPERRQRRWAVPLEKQTGFRASHVSAARAPRRRRGRFAARLHGGARGPLRKPVRLARSFVGSARVGRLERDGQRGTTRCGIANVN